MPISQARIETERASRYLVQLCRHIKQLAETQTWMQAHTQWSDDSGTIDFGWSQCALRADPAGLTLWANAATPENLRHLEQRIADRLTKIGRRDRLTVVWMPLDDDEHLQTGPD